MKEQEKINNIFAMAILFDEPSIKYLWTEKKMSKEQVKQIANNWNPLEKKIELTNKAKRKK